MLKFCLFSFITTRLFYISLIGLIYNSSIITKYELSPKILAEYTSETPFIEVQILKFLEHFSSYDAVFFIENARNSYTNDSNFAFFPLFAMLIRGCSNFLSVILYNTTNPRTVYLLSGFFGSNVFCLMNTILLSAVINYLTNSKIKSKISVGLFLINPGTIFYISIYSENLYLLLQLLFLYLGITAYNHNSVILPVSVLIIGMMATRSNSLFLLSYFVVPCIGVIFKKGKLHETASNSSWSENFKRVFKAVRDKIDIIGKYCVLCGEAYFCFLWMSKYQPKQEICGSIKRDINVHSDKYNMFKNYCVNSPENKINTVYSYIQDAYWKVGFGKQYRPETLDRVLLSLPMNILGVYGIYKVVVYFDFRSGFFEMNLNKFLLKTTRYNPSPKEESNKIEYKALGKVNYEYNVRLNSFILGGFINFVVLFLVISGLAHPQINNRLLSGCPILYYLMSEDIGDYINGIGKKRGFVIIVFFISYSIGSCIMQVGSYGFA